MTRQPATAAGRALLADDFLRRMIRGIGQRNTLRHRWMLAAILAIEQEAATGSEGLAEALRHLGNTLRDIDWQNLDHDDTPDMAKARAFLAAHEPSASPETAAHEAGEGRGVKDTWGNDIAEHPSADCPTCGGSGFFKLPFGAPDDEREIEDEDNCECDCHTEPLP